MQKGINYYKRDFLSIKQQLIDYTKQHYPDTYQDFNDASIGMLLIELNAAIGDNLNFNIDKAVQETQIQYAQERESLLIFAKNMGIKVPFRRPSVSICDFSVDVPVNGDNFDLRYAPLIVRGAQVIGGGQIFETLYDIDFSSPFNVNNVSNRIIIPNFDNNGNIQSYTLTKRELVINGETKYTKREITSNDVKPFLEFVLPDADVLSVEGITQLTGTNYNRLPSLNEQFDENNKWYEVESLAQQYIFKEQPLQVTDRDDIMAGKWEKVTQKYVTEYTNAGFMKVRFGGGVFDVEQSEYISDSNALLNELDNNINYQSTGEIPSANTTLFIKYRVGGGARSNIGANTINNLRTVNIFVDGPNSTINTSVQTSLTVNNPIPALGGVDEVSTEQLRNLIKFNTFSQNRAITIADYKIKLMELPGKFGAPHKFNINQIDNKILVSILGINSDKKLTNSSTSTLKENIAEYLSKKRALNDYVLVEDGKIINIATEFNLFVEPSFNKNEIALTAINTIYDFFNIDNREMGDDVKIAQLIEKVNNIGGVLNVVSYKFFNKVGGSFYSINEINQRLLDATTREIDLQSQNIIIAQYNEMLEIKYKNKDITIRFTE